VKRVAFTLAAMLAAPTAFADNALRPEQIPAKAKELATRGRIYHDAGDYSMAIAAFKEAYVLAPSPGLLFNIAQAYRLAGNCDEAAWMYRRYLDTNPTGTNRQLAEQHLATVEKCGSGGLRMAVIQPKLAPKVPTPQGAALGATLGMAVAGSDGEAHQVDQPSLDRAHTYKRYGIVVGAAGGASLVGAGIFALQSRDASQSVENKYKKGGKWEDVKDDDARGKRDAMFAKVLGIGGGVAVASGAILYALGHHYESDKQITVMPTSSGAQVSLSWGF
jgi:tetratricopeptide (TPR) repeat protein